MHSKPNLSSSPAQTTVVLIPTGRCKDLPRAVDELYRTTRQPFRLIVVESNAPDAVRLSLEEKARAQKSMKVLYSDRRQKPAEAFNLAWPHIQTEYALFLNDGARPCSGWLENLLKTAQAGHAHILIPFVGAGESSENLEGIFADRAARNTVGKFDESPVLDEVFVHKFLIQGKRNGLSIAQAAVIRLDQTRPQVPEQSFFSAISHGEPMRFPLSKYYQSARIRTKSLIARVPFFGGFSS